MAGKRKSPSSTRAVTNQINDSVPEIPLSSQGTEIRIEPGATLEVEEASWFQSPNALFDCHIQVVSIERQKGKGKAVPVTREIRPVEMLVYIYLRRCGNNGAKTFPSYTTIATRCRITRPTAIKAVETLARSGLLTKQPTITSKGDRGPNNYYLRSPKGTPFKACEGVVKSAYQGSSKMSIPPVVKPAYQGGMLILPYKEPSIKNHLDKQQQLISDHESITDRDCTEKAVVVEPQTNFLSPDKDEPQAEPPREHLNKMIDVLKDITGDRFTLAAAQTLWRDGHGDMDLILGALKVAGEEYRVRRLSGGKNSIHSQMGWFRSAVKKGFVQAKEDVYADIYMT